MQNTDHRSMEFYFKVISPWGSMLRTRNRFFVSKVANSNKKNYEKILLWKSDSDGKIFPFSSKQGK
jgi:hypothetical protein